MTRSDLKQERSFFRGSVSTFLQLVVAKNFLFSTFLTNWLDFTKTIIPLALMASESIAHEAEGRIGY